MENFCSLKNSGLISECLASDLNGRKSCRFYKKLSHGEECSHYRFDSFCDCVKAQRNENITELILEEEQNEYYLYRT